MGVFTYVDNAVSTVLSSRLRAAVCWNSQRELMLIFGDAAAFGRLCVEAITLDRFEEILRQAAVSARLCVETLTH